VNLRRSRALSHRSGSMIRSAGALLSISDASGPLKLRVAGFARRCGHGAVSIGTVSQERRAFPMIAASSTAATTHPTVRESSMLGNAAPGSGLRALGAAGNHTGLARGLAAAGWFASIGSHWQVVET
jgi:hypothetical protein